MSHHALASAAKAAAIEAGKIAGNVTEAAKAAGVDRRTINRWRQDDPAFAAAWESASEEAWDRLEREALRRAVDGWDDPVFYEGVQVGSRKVYSDRLAELVIKAKRAKEYREKPTLDVNLSGNVTVAIDLSSVLGNEERKVEDAGGGE